MSLEVLHVLINVYDLRAVRLNLLHEALNQLSELGVLFLNKVLVFLVLPTDVGEELLKVLRIIHDQLVDYGLVKVNARELIGVTFDDHSSHGSKMLRDGDGALLHDKDVLALDLLKEAHVCLDVLEQGLEPHRDVEGLFNLCGGSRSDQSLTVVPVFVLLRGGVAGGRD